MGYQDRAYTRSSGGGGWNIFNWLLTGSVPLFTAFGIRVRAHSSLVVLVGLVLLFGLGTGMMSLQHRITFASVVFIVVLLHEFGHCFAARAVGGTADDIMMSPLGGLAFASAPRRPFPTFVTVACGPLVNVLLMLLAAVVLYSTGGSPAWNPFAFKGTEFTSSWGNVSFYAAWFFIVSYALLLFNLIPSFPLDGGQLVQSVLWKFVGYYRSMVISLTVGIVGGAGMILFGLLQGLDLMLVLVGVSCLMTCVSMRAQVKAAGPWAFQEEEDADYSAAQWRPSQVSARDAKAEAKAVARAQAEAAKEEAEQRKIDRILEKVGREGMHSLSWMEKRTLKKATERQRQRTLRGRR